MLIRWNSCEWYHEYFWRCHYHKSLFYFPGYQLLLVSEQSHSSFHKVKSSTIKYNLLQPSQFIFMFLNHTPQNKHDFPNENQGLIFRLVWCTYIVMQSFLTSKTKRNILLCGNATLVSDLLRLIKYFCAILCTSLHGNDPSLCLKSW